MYIHIYIYTCTYTYTRTRTYTCTYICVHIQTFIHANKIICTFYGNVQVQTCASHQRMPSPMYRGFTKSILANDIPKSKHFSFLVYACRNTQRAYLQSPQYRCRRRTVPYREGDSCVFSPTWNVASQRVSENWTQGRDSDTSVSRWIVAFFVKSSSDYTLRVHQNWSENRNNPAQESPKPWNEVDVRIIVGIFRIIYYVLLENKLSAPTAQSHPSQAVIWRMGDSVPEDAAEAAHFRCMILFTHPINCQLTVRPLLFIFTIFPAIPSCLLMN